MRLRDRIARQPVLGEGSTPDVPPAAFGRFKLLHHIRDGSLGPVFRAEDPDTEHPVTIQQLRVKASLALVRRITDGLSALVGSMPDHPSVPRVLEAGADDNHPFIVTTNFDGDTLDEALRDYGPAEIEDALPRLQDLAKALDKAANVGVWHGLLQPRDIVIAANATGLTGLGIAPVLERAGARVAPRQAYAAPEVLEGHPSSPAADQFSLAAVAYEWLFGQRLPNVTSARLDVPVIPGINHEVLTYAFRTALASDPSDRFESCCVFVEAIGNSTVGAAFTAGTAGASDSQDTLATEDGTLGTASTIVTPDTLGTPGTSLTIGTPGLSETSEISTDDLHFDSEPAAAAASGAELSRATGPSPMHLGESLLVRDEPPLGVPDEPVIVGNDPVIVPEDSDIVPDDPVLVRDHPVPGSDHPKFPSFAEPSHDTAPAVPRRGSLTAADEKPGEQGRGRFTWTALAAVLVVGFASGLAAGYVLGNRNQQTPAIDGTDSAAAGAATREGREFTDAPVPASAPASAGSAPTEERASATPAAAPAARVSTASLLVRSTPAGAAVTVDGASRGTTPLTLRDLEIGTRKVVVSRPGYAPAERRITLSKDRPSRSLEVRLSPLRGEAARQARRLPVQSTSTTGSLLVDSRPAGAAVTIDGRAAGTTPLTVPAVAAGSHEIRIDLGGYTPVTTTVAVKAGERARVAATLVRGQQE